MVVSWRWNKLVCSSELYFRGKTAQECKECREESLAAYRKSFPELICREVSLANSPPKAKLGPSLQPSPSPVLQFSGSANILGAYCKGRH